MPKGEYVMNTNHLPTTMQAAVLRGPRSMSIERVPVPQLAPNEVLVEVEANGLCGSDVHCYTGERVLEYPMVLGHEIAGHIVATGANVSAPHDYAWSIPETFSLRDAATIEPTTVGVHAFSRGQLKPGETLAVIGCGGVGLLIVTIAVASGNRVVVLEPNPTRGAAALAAGAVQYSEARNADEARAFFEREGVVAIFECAGIRATAQLALDAAPPGTRIVLVGLT